MDFNGNPIEDDGQDLSDGTANIDVNAIEANVVMVNGRNVITEAGNQNLDVTLTTTQTNFTKAQELATVKFVMDHHGGGSTGAYVETDNPLSQTMIGSLVVATADGESDLKITSGSDSGDSSSLTLNRGDRDLTTNSLIFSSTDVDKWVVGSSIGSEDLKVINKNTDTELIILDRYDDMRVNGNLFLRGDTTPHSSLDISDNSLLSAVKNGIGFLFELSKPITISSLKIKANQWVSSSSTKKMRIYTDSGTMVFEGSLNKLTTVNGWYVTPIPHIVLNVGVYRTTCIYDGLAGDLSDNTDRTYSPILNVTSNCRGSVSGNDPTFPFLVSAGQTWGVMGQFNFILTNTKSLHINEVELSSDGVGSILVEGGLKVQDNIDLLNTHNLKGIASFDTSLPIHATWAVNSLDMNTAISTVDNSLTELENKTKWISDVTSSGSTIFIGGGGITVNAGMMVAGTCFLDNITPVNLDDPLYVSTRRGIEIRTTNIGDKGLVNYGRYSQIQDLFIDTAGSQNLLGGGIGSTRCGKLFKGDTNRFRFGGIYNCDNGDKIEFTLMGGVNGDIPIFTSSPLEMRGPAIDSVWKLDLEFTVRETGSSGMARIFVNGMFNFIDRYSTAEGGGINGLTNNSLNLDIENKFMVYVHLLNSSTQNITSQLGIFNKTY